MELRKLPHDLTVCKVESLDEVNLASGFFFVGKTEDELSLVCLTDEVPSATIEREDGWKGFVVQGKLDFSLIGILSKISGALADAGIGLFAVSTFNTDYILVKAEDFNKAADALVAAGCSINESNRPGHFDSF